MTITSEIFKRVSSYIKMESDEQSVKSGGYGETRVTYRMALKTEGLGLPFTELEVIDRYDCADGVQLGSRLVARDQDKEMVLAEIDSIYDEHDVVTSFIEDEYDDLDGLKSEREDFLLSMMDYVPQLARPTRKSA